MKSLSIAITLLAICRANLANADSVGNCAQAPIPPTLSASNRYAPSVYPQGLLSLCKGTKSNNPQDWNCPEGKTQLDVKVDRNGKTVTTRIVRSSGFRLLDQGAMAIVKSWSFVPAAQCGKPVEGHLSVTIDSREHFAFQ